MAIVTNYEKYLILSGMSIRESDTSKEDRIGDELDKLWASMKDYHRECARKALSFAVDFGRRIDRV